MFTKNQKVVWVSTSNNCYEGKIKWSNDSVSAVTLENVGRRKERHLIGRSYLFRNESLCDKAGGSAVPVNFVG